MNYLKLPAVTEICGLSRSSIYAMMSTGEFPKQRKIGTRSVAWLDIDIYDWVQSRPIAE